MTEQRLRWSGRRKVALRTLFAAVIVVGSIAPVADADPFPPNPDQNKVVRTVYDQPTNVPGKSLRAVTVHYPPGGKSAAHHHANSAFIMAYVIFGSIRSQLESSPGRVYHEGETWTETPGARHLVSENASATEPAELIAVFLLDSEDAPLTTDDDANK
ncbi:cupin domain-containing protein [Mycolicibacterium sp. XJ2]